MSVEEASDFLDGLIIVPADADHEGLVYSSFIKSTRESKRGRSMPYKAHCLLAHDTMERIMKHGRVVCLVDPTDPEWTCGWLASDQIADRYVFHYAYTKHRYRRAGVFNRLLEWDLADRGLTLRGAVYTHARKPWSDMLEARGLRHVEM